jgi:hypothetical protein
MNFFHVSKRCHWQDGCRKWCVPGEKVCKMHLTWDDDLQKKALQDAIDIEKLEMKVKIGKATPQELLDRQRKSVADEVDGSETRKSLLEIALEEEEKIASTTKPKTKTLRGRMTAAFSKKKKIAPPTGAPPKNRTKTVEAPKRGFDEMNGKAFDELSKQNSETTNLIIHSLRDDPLFQGLAQTDMESIMIRDAEDEEKLAVGIQIAIDKNVLSALDDPPIYFKVDVLGKTAGMVADEIIAEVGSDATSTGGVIVLCGLSGTGKGTTVAKLMEKLPKTVAWSNGNVFRSVAMLCSLHCKQEAITFPDETVLSPENLASWMGMLHFQYDPQHHTHDIQIQAEALGVDGFVSQIKNTDLKSPEVQAILPTVAKYIQGEVIKFANDATTMMCSDGNTVILEGRAQTVNYVDTKNRFELVMSDPSMIGKRRAAQRIAALALEDCALRRVPSHTDLTADVEASTVSDDDVMLSVKRALAKLCGVVMDEAGAEEGGDRARDDSVWPKRVPTAANEGEAVYIQGAVPVDGNDRADRADSVWPKRVPTAANEGEAVYIQGAVPVVGNDRADRADSVWPKKVPTAANEGEAVFIEGAKPTPEAQAILDAEVAAAADAADAAVAKEEEEEAAKAAEDAAATAKAAGEAVERDYTAELTAFYQEHNPEKLEDADFVKKTLVRYVGKEKELMEHLKAKYTK